MSRLSNIVTNNWSLKLLALVLAALSFYAIRSTTSFTIPYDIVLEVDVAESGITVLEQPETVRVTFRGSLDDLGRLDPGRIRVVVHPEATNPTGIEVVTIDRGDIEGAHGVTVGAIEPSEVTLSFDREIVRKFKVAKPKTSGSPLRGRVELVYEPDQVMVRGSERRLATIEKLALDTEPVVVDGRVKSFVTKARVLPPSPSGLWRIVPPEVNVTVSIVTETVSRQWTNVAVRAVMPHQRAVKVAFEPEVVDVTLTGRAEAVNEITGASLTVFVDCVGLDTPGSYELPVTVHLPKGEDLTVAVEPDVVKVVLEQDKGL